MSNQTFPRVTPAGDCGIMVLFGDTLDTAVNTATHAFDTALRTQSWEGVEEVTPAIRGLLVRYDPLTVPMAALSDKLSDLLASKNWLESEPDPNRRIWRLPALYGGEHGPDLENVAELLGQTVERTIAEHCESAQTVLMLGFAPGCAYLGSLPPQWDLPRLDYIKPEVPPGSISVAVRQTVLFATAIPTGWRTIARTPFLSFSKVESPYFYLAPGDEIVFEPINAETFDALSNEVANGKTIVSPEAPD